MSSTTRAPVKTNEPVSAVRTPFEIVVHRLVPPEDRIHAFARRFPGAVILRRACRMLSVLWLGAGVVVIAAHHQYLKHHMTSGLVQTNWMVGEIVATVVGSAIFAFMAVVLHVLRDVWERQDR
jgi:hypothetical protein